VSNCPIKQAHTSSDKLSGSGASECGKYPPNRSDREIVLS
jgi:hypothetical protein